MGGWNPAQFAEKRLPTLAELDAALPNHPALIFQAFTGPAATNTRGKAFFASKGVAVSDAGAIAANAPSLAALNALRAAQTFDDRQRGTADAMAYAASVGLTTNVDMGAFNLPGTPDLQGSFEADTLASADQGRMYDALVALHARAPCHARPRLFDDDTLPTCRAFGPAAQHAGGFGSDLLRISGIGGFETAGRLFARPPPTTRRAGGIAKADGPSSSTACRRHRADGSTFEAVNRRSRSPLAWSWRTPRPHSGTMARLTAMGAAIAVHPFSVLSGGRVPRPATIVTRITVGRGPTRRRSRR